MEISITQELEEYVADKVASGRFSSPSEVFEAAIEAFRSEDRDIEQWLVNEVVPVLDELEADPTLAIPIDAAFAQIREHHALRVKSHA